MKARQVFSGLYWTTSAALVNLLAQLVFLAVLSRLLAPAAFGLMLMAMVAVRFASYFAQFGGAQTLVQAPELKPSLATASLLITAAISIGLYFALIVISPAISWYFQSPQLIEILRVFGLSLPLSAIGALPMAVLRRQGRFKASSAIEVVAYVLGYGVVGVLLAYRGAGVWSLVAATLAQQALVLGLAFLAARYPLEWPVAAPAWGQMFNKGSRYSLIGFLEFLWANVEALLVGRVFGQAMLGLLNRAQMLCSLPVEQAVNTTSKVLFPALSSMQQDRVRMGDGFLVMLLGTGVLSAAISSGVAAAAHDLVALLLGPNWLEAISLVQLLAASVAAMFVYVVCGITLDSLAELRAKLQMQFGLLFVKVAAVLWLSAWGMQGIVLAIVCCEVLRAALGLRLVVRALSIDHRMLWRVLAVMFAAAAGTYGAVWLARLAADASPWPLWARLAAQAAAGALALAAVLSVCLGRWRRFSPLVRFESLSHLLGQLHRFIYRVPRT